MKAIFNHKYLDSTENSDTNSSLPSCAVLIAAYNEEDIIKQKISNTFQLIYPSHLLKIYIIADGSSDKTVEAVSEFHGITLLYDPIRKGKVNAIQRALQYIDSEVVVFTDANTFLNKESLVKICNHYADPTVGGVAGEKRIYVNDKADASSAGESFYWKYESKLKKLDSELHSTIGAAGELFSIRRNLFDPVNDNIILDDFLISMKIACQGYKIKYEPKAYAIESSSLNTKEELKRKIRISAGGVQAIIVLRNLLNPLKRPLLSFQYLSHRVLRWIVTPILIIVVLFSNIALIMHDAMLLYNLLLIFQVVFYLLAFLGFLLEKHETKIKIFFIPYYFCLMNYAALAGIVKYFGKNQSSMWAKSERKTGYEPI